MAQIDLLQFRGEVPRAAVRKLPLEAAAQATNIRFNSGDLEAWRSLLPISATLRSGLVKSLFLYEDTHWFSWNGHVSAVKSPIAQDDFARVYYTGDGVPKVTSNLIATSGGPKPSNDYDLGVPAPEGTIDVAVTEVGDIDAADFSDDETRFYVYTFVTGYGEEGPPSMPSLAAELRHPATDSIVLTIPVPFANTQNITKKRLYRTVTTGDSTEYFYVGDVPLSQTSFTDKIKDTQLGGLLKTVDFDPPPANMQGMVSGENGIVAGFAGNEFIPSMANLPSAYPAGFRHAFEHDVVAIAATSTGFVVATEGYPHAIIGVTPGSLTSEKLEVKQACVSGPSLVDMGEFAIYASPDGLVAAGVGRAELITPDLFGQDEWAAFYPETIHAYYYEDLYIAFYGDTAGTGHGVGGFIYNPKTSDFVRLDFYATAGYNDLKTDSLYLVVNGQLNAWNRGLGLLTYYWKSKIFKGDATAFTCAKVYTVDPANVGVALLSNGVKILDRASLPSEAFRLPSVRGEEWQVELTGTAPIHRFAMDYALGDLE